jgi:anti-sigma factor RsiW
MNHPADHRATLLRERLDRLASSVPTGNGVDGAQLYRRSLRRRRRRLVTSTGLVAAATALVIGGGAIWLPGTNDDGAPRPDNGQPPVAGQGSADARAEVLAGVDDPGGRTAGQTV